MPILSQTVLCDKHEETEGVSHNQKNISPTEKHIQLLGDDEVSSHRIIKYQGKYELVVFEMRIFSSNKILNYQRINNCHRCVYLN